MEVGHKGRHEREHVSVARSGRRSVLPDTVVVEKLAEGVEAHDARIKVITLAVQLATEASDDMSLQQ